MKQHDRPARKRRGFTMVEVMIAISIFMMVMATVYSTWIAVIRASQTSLRAAANAQRSRIAVRTLHDALLTTVNHQWNQNGPYTFTADFGSGYTDLKFAARLPDSFPGVGRYGGSIVRQLQFTVEPGEGGKNELVLYQRPLLLPKETGDFSPYRLVLSPDVSQFEITMLEERTGKYEPLWLSSNTLPRLVQITLGLGRKDGSDTPLDLTHTFIAIPAMPVTRDIQGLRTQVPGGPQ